MDNTQIFIFAALFAVVGYRLYNKFVKKDNKNADGKKETSSGAGMPASKKNDDYEPYLKK